MRDGLLEARIERDGPQSVVLHLVGTGDLRAQRAAGMFGKLVGVFGKRRMVTHLFEDAGQVADGDALGQQVLQNTLHLADVELRRHQFIHQRRVRQFEVVQQHLNVLPAENFVAAPADGLAQVGDQDGRGIHHREAAHLGRFALGVPNPGCGQLKDRLDGRHAFEHGLALGGVHRQPMTRTEFALGHQIALEQEAVFVRTQLQVVPQTNRRNNDAHLLREIAAHAGNAFEQITAMPLVRQGDQPVTELDLERVQVQQLLQLVHRLGFTDRRGRAIANAFGRSGRRGLREGWFEGTVAIKRVRQQTGKGAQNQKGEHWQAGHKREDAHHRGQHSHGARIDQ